NPSCQRQALPKDLGRLVVVPPIFVNVPDDAQHGAQTGKVLVRLEDTAGRQSMLKSLIETAGNRLRAAEFVENVRLGWINQRAAPERRLEDVDRFLDIP